MVVDCVGETDPEREPDDEPVLLIELLGAAELELNGDCVGEPLVERETAGDTLCVGDAVCVCVGVAEPEGVAACDTLDDCERVPVPEGVIVEVGVTEGVRLNVAVVDGLAVRVTRA